MAKAPTSQKLRGTHKKFKWFKNHKKEILTLLVFIAIFIGIRSVHFSEYLNFSGDQGQFALESFKIWETKKPTLIGPPISFYFKGRDVFQGPATYYEFLAFLLLGRFDPVVSSYIFMLYCSLMVVPLYYGTKMLVGKRAALVLTAIYTLVPYYINFSRFLWNPTFQFSLLPLLIFLMGWHKKTKNNWVFLAMAVLLGILLQYHYQFILVIIGLLIYYLFVVRVGLWKFILYISGVAAGFSPIILFELRNNFYNTNTVLLFLQNWDAVKKPAGERQHYYLTLSFLLLTLALGVANKWLENLDKKTFKRMYLGFVTVLLICAVVTYLPKPEHSFWALDNNWNYPSEKKAYDIIRDENLSEYGLITIIGYDNLSSVIKYLHKKDGKDLVLDDYWHTKYLYVIARKNLKYYYMDDPAFGIQAFRPFKEINRWELNPSFNLYLVQRTK